MVKSKTECVRRIIKYPCPRISGGSVLESVIDQLLQKNSDLKTQVLGLHETLGKRTAQLKSVVISIEELKEKAKESDQRVETQQNDLVEYKISMQEFYLSFDSSLPHQEPMPTCKQFWILRKHQKNLMVLTKPFIYGIIIASTEGGLVSTNIGKCAVNCSIPGHDCAGGFYKALLVTVGNSPHMLEVFLQMMLNNFDGQPLGRLCKRMLVELKA